MVSCCARLRLQFRSVCEDSGHDEIDGVLAVAVAQFFGQRVLIEAVLEHQTRRKEAIGRTGDREVEQLRVDRPKHARLHAIADDLLAIQRRNFYQLRADVSHRGRYSHEYCMAISVERDSPTYQDMTADAEDAVIEALRDLARWLYRQLEREYEYLSSDEAVDETITANQYTFTETGRRFG